MVISCGFGGESKSLVYSRIFSSVDNQSNALLKLDEEAYAAFFAVIVLLTTFLPVVILIDETKILSVTVTTQLARFSRSSAAFTVIIAVPADIPVTTPSCTFATEVFELSQYTSVFVALDGITVAERDVLWCFSRVITLVFKATDSTKILFVTVTVR